MIQTIEARPVSGNLGESKAFTIKVTGKAFDALINSLYSNKPLAVLRELATNAYDSHVEHGNPERPIEITLPSALNPVLTIRDYGVSMNHEMVMDRYSTLFDSTKDASNLATGMFGIGSKSPFAYTTTFGVRAILDGEARTYLVYLDAEGIPQISHVDSSPTSEEQGFEITVNVKAQDYGSFRVAAERVLLGFRGLTQPKVFGGEVNLGEVVLSGTNWTLYRPTNDYPSDYIQQGCVVYPLDSGYRVSTRRTQVVISVPIGTVNVASSREQMAYDEKSRKAIDQLVVQVQEEIKVEAKKLLDKTGSKLERARRAIFLSDLIQIDQADSMIEIEAFGFKAAYPRKGESHSVLNWIAPDHTKLTWVWGRDAEGVVRKASRLRAFNDAQRKSSGRRYSEPRVMIAPEGFTAADAAQFILLTGIDASLVRHVSDLPDPGPVSKDYTPSGEPRRKSVKVFPEGACYWLRQRGRYARDDRPEVPESLHRRIGFNPNTAIELTSAEITKLGVEYTAHWRRHVQRLIEGSKSLRDELITVQAIQLIKRQAINEFAGARICEAVGLVAPVNTPQVQGFTSSSYDSLVRDDALDLCNAAFECYPALHSSYRISNQDILDYISTKGESK